MQAQAQVANSPSGDLINGAGAAGHVVSSTGIAWVPTPGTPHDIVWNTPVFDTDTFWAGGSPSLFTMPLAGVYAFNVQMDYTSVSVDTATLEVVQNGSTTLNKYYFAVASTGSTLSLFFNDIIRAELAAGDTIKFKATFTGGGEFFPNIYGSLSLLGTV